MSELSPFQQETKAKTIAARIRVKAELESLDAVLNKLFDDAPAEVREATSPDEVAELVSAINAGTAEQNKIARFLELADKFGLT